MKFLVLIVQFMQVALAIMIIGFLIMQYRARGRGTRIIQRLRRHIVWQTSALLAAFITSIFVSQDGYAHSILGLIIAFVITFFMFITFLSGTKIFFEIASGKHDDTLK